MKNNTDTNDSLLQSWLKKDITEDAPLLNDEEKITKQAEKRVLSLFTQAATRVPAYKKFLQKHGVNPSLIKTIADYHKLPVTTKENYIDMYNFKDRCWDGTFESMHMISTSSGTTGKPHYWPRNFENEIEGAYVHELLFREVFHIDTQKTLFINGFALGNWIAGTFTSACVNLVSLKGYPLTMMSPGYVTDSILEVLEEVAGEFEQVIISGHVPFLKEIAELAAKKKVNTQNIKLLGTGQGITENWREYLLKTLDSSSDNTVINLYGSADAALMGFETPLSVILRKQFYNNSALNKRFFGQDRVPSLYNYDPRFTYFEVDNGELCITKNLGCPLFRYNIHDEGGIISYEEMVTMLDKSEALPSYLKQLRTGGWKLPFVYLFGRDKFMVKIYGANIYSEHVQHALNHNTLQPLITGRYLMEMNYNEENNPELVCRVELNPELQDSPELAQLIEQVFVDEITKINSEYQDVLSRMGHKVRPKIKLYEHGNQDYFSRDKIKKTS
ncbi:MAG TPA: hypothetical protein VND99_01320 [Candidatus Acidoferrales bacterium]|nr:hypothetical protein [Candidatus Acidoferrales bacterium]